MLQHICCTSAALLHICCWSAALQHICCMLLLPCCTSASLLLRICSASACCSASVGLGMTPLVSHSASTCTAALRSHAQGGSFNGLAATGQPQRQQQQQQQQQQQPLEDAAAGRENRAPGSPRGRAPTRPSEEGLSGKGARHQRPRGGVSGSTSPTRSRQVRGVGLAPGRAWAGLSMCMCVLPRQRSFLSLLRVLWGP